MHVYLSISRGSRFKTSIARLEDHTYKYLAFHQVSQAYKDDCTSLDTAVVWDECGNEPKWLTSWPTGKPGYNESQDSDSFFRYSKEALCGKGIMNSSLEVHYSQVFTIASFVVARFALVRWHC